jgi:hypothetical protein
MLDALDPDVRAIVEGIDLSSLDEEKLDQIRSLSSGEIPASGGTSDAITTSTKSLASVRSPTGLLVSRGTFRACSTSTAGASSWAAT